MYHRFLVPYVFILREYFKIHSADGTEVFNQQGCKYSLPYGTALEVPFGSTNHIMVEIFLEYRWSDVKVKYSVLNQGLNSG